MLFKLVSCMSCLLVKKSHWVRLKTQLCTFKCLLKWCFERARPCAERTEDQSLGCTLPILAMIICSFISQTLTEWSLLIWGCAVGCRDETEVLFSLRHLEAQSWWDVTCLYNTLAPSRPGDATRAREEGYILRPFGVLAPRKASWRRCHDG